MTHRDDPTHFRPEPRHDTENVIPINGDGDPTRTRDQRAPEPLSLRTGMVIKKRFQLLECLGRGGMGEVYKALDLIKHEAHDRHPYLAIKVLSEDFKNHPEAFIAFQRESSKQQRLAHPNIATVYDFDRIDDTDSQVYITMELLEGLPLDIYIQTKIPPGRGLSFKKAIELIKDMVAALSYAHAQKIVHSDLKPGNIFFCHDGTVKILDFGIARVMNNPLNPNHKTLFDPSKLEAYTPAYASPEMLEGLPADPRNDIFALGCVAYELLSGKHPFNSLTSTQARECNLIPDPIDGLSRQQQKALLHSLAFKREERTLTVEKFLQELEAKSTWYHWYRHPITIAISVVLVLGLLSSIAYLMLGSDPVAQTQITKKTVAIAPVISQTKTLAKPLPAKKPIHSTRKSNQLTPPAPKKITQTAPAKKNKAIVHTTKSSASPSLFSIAKGTMMPGELRVFVINRKSDKIEIFLKNDIIGERRTLSRGTRLYGKKRYNSSTRRLEINLTRGITPNGESFALRATVFDSNLEKGLKGLVTISEQKTSISVPPQLLIINVERTF